MKWIKFPVIAALTLAGMIPARAQIGDIVNGLTNVALPAIQQGPGIRDMSSLTSRLVSATTEAFSYSRHLAGI